MTGSHKSWAILSQGWLRADEYRMLVREFDSADGIVRQSQATLERAGLDSDKAERIAAPLADAVEATLRWLEPADQALVSIDDPDYPALLANIPNPPLALYIKGRAETLCLPGLAVVGSRNPTEGGLRNAREFAAYLAGTGFVIVSGLAEGIDKASHEGALSVDAPTIAVMGTGVDRVYPARHRDLAHQIAGTGALVSEYPLDTPPRRRHFPDRNRIITGLSLGTLVVEAARQSGSLISARLAAEQGREVFAIPGSIHNPLARGCHQLIRQGAKLVESSADILSELGPLVAHLKSPAAPGREASTSNVSKDDSENEERQILLNSIGFDPVSVDELLNQSGLTIAELSSMLLILELEGSIEKLNGDRYARLD